MNFDDFLITIKKFNYLKLYLELKIGQNNFIVNLEINELKVHLILVF